MADREGMSKRLRFEIFKRDGFRCVYCGARPTETPLQVDHVVAVASGGTDDPANLVTSCQPCNGGKSDVSLDAKKYVRDLSVDGVQDHAEQVRAYLDAQRAVVAAKRGFAEDIAGYWRELFGCEAPRPFLNAMPGALRTVELANVFDAISIAARHREFGADERDTYENQESRSRYALGVLKKFREKAAPLAVAAPAPTLPQPSSPSPPKDHALEFHAQFRSELAVKSRFSGAQMLASAILDMRTQHGLSDDALVVALVAVSDAWEGSAYLKIEEDSGRYRVDSRFGFADEPGAQDRISAAVSELEKLAVVRLAGEYDPNFGVPIDIASDFVGEWRGSDGLFTRSGDGYSMADRPGFVSRASDWIVTQGEGS